MRTRYLYEHELRGTYRPVLQPLLNPPLPAPGRISGLSGCAGCGGMGELSMGRDSFSFFDALKLVSAVYVLTGWRKGDEARIRTGAFLGTGAFGTEILSKFLAS